METRKWETKKARDLLKHVKCESRDAEKVVGCSNLGLRGGQA